MQTNSSSSDISSNSVGRARHRKKSTEAVTDGKKTKETNLLVNDQNKYKSMLIRTYSSLCMMAGFVLVVYMGHLYIWAMVVVIQYFMARELFNLLMRVNEARRLPWFRLLNWHFFFTAMLFTYGRFLSHHLVNTVTTDKLLYKLVSALVKYQMLICYFFYIAGFMWFILTLKKKMYKYQFKQYAWTHMILLLVFAQSSFTVANIFEGIFWFLLPASLIAINDVAAYFFGFFFGRTPLIKLSPKKTWEGFIGASVTTIISAFPVTVFDAKLAPFGGFLASGFMCAFKIKLIAMIAMVLLRLEMSFVACSMSSSVAVIGYTLLSCWLYILLGIGLLLSQLMQRQGS